VVFFTCYLLVRHVVCRILLDVKKSRGPTYVGYERVSTASLVLPNPNNQNGRGHC
jgi:hypothetical protein